jgi:hypothetical protein
MASDTLGAALTVDASGGRIESWALIESEPPGDAPVDLPMGSKFETTLEGARLSLDFRGGFDSATGVARCVPDSGDRTGDLEAS